MAPSWLKKCCVENCEATSATHRLYCFPRNDNLRNIWMSFLVPQCSRLLGLEKYQLVQRRVCEKHFLKRHISQDGKRDQDAYPCLFTEAEISHGVPLAAPGEEVTDHSYFKNQDDTDSIAEEVLTIGQAADKQDCRFLVNSDHSYAVKEGKFCMQQVPTGECPDESIKETLKTSSENSQVFGTNVDTSNKNKPKHTEIVTTFTDKNIGPIICGTDPNYNEKRDPSAMDYIDPRIEAMKTNKKLDREHMETNLNYEYFEDNQSFNDVDPSFCDVDQNSETLPTFYTGPEPILLLDVDQPGLMDESQLDVDLHVEEEQSGTETYICDGCGVVISGARYACVQCERDECVTCASSGPQHPHYVLRVPNTANNCEARAVIAAVRRVVRDCLDPPQVKIEVKDEEDPQPEYYIEELDSDSAILHLTSDNIQQNQHEEADIPSRLDFLDTNIHPETTSSTKTRPQTIPGRTRSSVQKSTTKMPGPSRTYIPEPFKSFREPVKSTDNFLFFSSVTDKGVSIDLTRIDNDTADATNMTYVNIAQDVVNFAPDAVDFAPVRVEFVSDGVESTPGPVKCPRAPIIVHPYPYKHPRRKGQSGDDIALADFFKPASVRLERLDPATIAAVTSTCDGASR